MNSDLSSLSTALAILCRDQIHQAGHRYTPGIDHNAPNLRIDYLFKAIDNVSCGHAAQKRFQSVLDEFKETWSRTKYLSQHVTEIEQLIKAASIALPSFVERLRCRDDTAAEEWIDYLSKIEAQLIADETYWHTEEAKLSSRKNPSPSRNTIRSGMDSIHSLLSIIRDEIEYAETPSFKLLFSPLLLISGEWGTGKTHLLCDITNERLNREAPTALMLAKNFEGNIVEEFCRQIGNEESIKKIFADLDEIGTKASERTLFIVDGINEGHRDDWQLAIGTLLSIISEHPNIGLVVTCRTPFESLAIEKSDLTKFHRLLHYGFDDQEFDAQAAFFQYYQLPLPEVPLLDREFARPLTLKLICQSLQTLSSKKLAKGFAGIASGQRGMTYVLESFVKSIGEPIEKAFGLQTKGCWILLKGNDKFTNQQIAGFASCMATNLRGYVLPTEAIQIIAANYPTLRRDQQCRLLESMRTNGLLEEDVIWYSTESGQKESRVVYRLPYQRFSDHLIARHLLKTYLDVSSLASIKKSFVLGSPLGRVFEVKSQNFGHYAEPGWAQALITEFPERVGNKMLPKQRELFFALPPNAQDLNAYFEPFIEGIFWRNPTSFTEGTRLIIDKYLRANSQTWERAVDALAAVAMKPSHPYHAKRLYDYLSRFTMPDRDLQWSEYLRRKYASPTIQRLLAWAEKLDTVTMTREVAAELVVLFSLILTTVVRSDRDLATKALVLIGEKHPDVLFSHVLTSLKFNDPYLTERVLAAAYGTVLSLVDSQKAISFRPLLGYLSQKIYRQMFAPRARHATHHTLTRDYAIGIIEIAQKAGCIKLPKSSICYLSRPFSNTPSTFSSNGTPDKLVKESIGQAIKMDFGNYTIGSLIPYRANYDNKKPEYVRVRSQIERRISDLGYKDSLFKEIDAEISRHSWNSADEYKVDRYGKKYSWIAYYEMWGERDAKRKLPDWRQGKRPADCGVDPSFPKIPPDWNPPLPDLFGPPSITTEDWVAGGYTPNWHPLLVVPEINGQPGEWILVEGFVRGVDSIHDREIFSFLRGMFVAKKDVEKLKSKFLLSEYPGNNSIPESAKEHYLFSGEPGRRQNFAKHLLGKNGKYRRQVLEAFVGHEYDHDHEDQNPPIYNNIPVTDSQNDSQSDFMFELNFPAIRRVPGIKVELPSIQFAWESYHSAYNTFSGFDIPSPSIIQRLQLSCCNREIDFSDLNGLPATMYREAGKEYFGNQHKLLYIRADLLRSYLQATRQTLVWCNWGERDWHKKVEGCSLLPNESRLKIFQSYKHIHRAFLQWSSQTGAVI